MSPSRGCTAHGGVNPWTAKTPGCGCPDGHLALISCASICGDISGPSDYHQRRHSTQYYSRGANLVVRSRRDRTMGEKNFDKLVNIGRGAALMTDTTMEMEPFGAAWPSLGNKAIAEAIQKNIEMTGMPKWTEMNTSLLGFTEVAEQEEGLPMKVAPLLLRDRTVLQHSISPGLSLRRPSAFRQPYPAFKHITGRQVSRRPCRSPIRCCGRSQGDGPLRLSTCSLHRNCWPQPKSNSSRTPKRLNISRYYRRSVNRRWI